MNRNPGYIVRPCRICESAAFVSIMDRDAVCDLCITIGQRQKDESEDRCHAAMTRAVCAILILCAVLLAGEVWAGEIPIPPDGCKLYQENNGVVKRICDGDEPMKCESVSLGKFVCSGTYQDTLSSCHQRMQEAMKLFNRYIVNPQEYRLPGAKHGMYQMPNEHELVEWKEVMRDCVTGK